LSNTKPTEEEGMTLCWIQNMSQLLDVAIATYNMSILVYIGYQYKGWSKKIRNRKVNFSSV